MYWSEEHRPKVGAFSREAVIHKDSRYEPELD